ncbi:MAG: type II toxin-antitoxin system RelE/ParE family toxin [Clostridia bacterium]|nr:type II toxin-antitoxin system RelE/ParE family toxin [Clostridia bacterium]
MEKAGAVRYKVNVTPRFEREFSKLDRYTMHMLKAWIEKNLVGCEDPRAHGKALKGDRRGEWRYRIGDYRLICRIYDGELVILALSVGHRRDIYK